MEGKKFAEGLRIFKPNAKAPAFVKADIVIKKEELINWLKDQPGEDIKLSVKESTKGNWYAEVNDYKPTQPQVQGTAKIEEDNDLPF